MKLYAENHLEGQKKSIHFQNQRAHNLETFVGIHKKNSTLLETSLLKNCWKLSSFSPNNWGMGWGEGDGVYIKYVAAEKHRFAAKKKYN